MARPTVDVVVPFAGASDELELTLVRLRALRLAPGDTLVVVDNDNRPRSLQPSGTRVVRRAEQASPGYARNRGAELGQAEWIAFLDADVAPRPDLLDRLFEPPPGERTALLGGAILDEPVPADAPAAARYAWLRRLMSQENTWQWGEWAFAQTANAACRRSAFEAIGGFREDLRAAEDADLSYRLRAADWEIERRDGAVVVHLSRRTVPAFVRNIALHGAGSGWLAREYPGAIPARRLPGLLWWGARYAIRELVRGLLRRDRERAWSALLEPLGVISYELGRHLPNDPRARAR